MKKQLSTAMAAAMAFGTVVPAFADSNIVKNSDNVVRESVNVRLARGVELYNKDGLVDKDGNTTQATVYNRYEVYNYNGSEDRSKHTLKTQFKDMQVLYTKRDKDIDNDKVVLGKKLSSSNVTDMNRVNLAKAKYDAMMAQIKAFEDNGFKKEVKQTLPTINANGEYVPGKEVVTLTPKNENLSLKTYEYTFDQIDSGIISSEDINSIREEVFVSLNIEETTTKTVDLEDDKIVVDFSGLENDKIYSAANKLKFAIENNIAKFDIVSDEAGVGNNDRIVKLYIKGAEQKDSSLVMTLTFKNFKLVDTNKIVDMPLLKDSDFKGHWAESTIVNAMLSGYVDASTTFRPKDSVTRAEFAKMLCTVLGIEYKDGQEEPFHDVASNAWYHKYITALYNASTTPGTIVNGYADSTFKPNEAITRQEAAKMIAQAFLLRDTKGRLTHTNKQGKDVVTVERVTDKNKGTVEKKYVSLEDAQKYGIEVAYKVNSNIVNADVKTTFKDDAEIKDWADASVQALKDSGVIKGYEGNIFKPNNSITRVEALLMITGDNRN